MGKIVYHGTFRDQPPHTHWKPFHAGSLQATQERAADQVEYGEVKTPNIQKVHAYEVADDAPMSRKTWNDPDIDIYHRAFEREGVPSPYPTSPVVPENKTNRIYPYQNAREDKGSTSYVIPSNFVGTHVKHLGVQFQKFHGTPEQENALMNAITSMSGGRLGRRN